MKYLIVNADDFGLNDCRDDAIKKLLQDRLITSASTMINQSNSQKAIKYINSNKLKCCGLHLALNKGCSSFDSSRNLALDLSHKTSYLTSLTDYHFYKKEIESQIKTAVQSWEVTHLDSHLHIHTFPVLYSSIITYMKHYKLEKIRNSFSDLTDGFKIKNLFKQYFRNIIIKNNLIMPEYLFNIFYFLNNISTILDLPDKSVIEVLCHPEISGNIDFELLTSSEYRKAISKFVNISYNELNT